jgi:hypothetical protein
MQGNVEQATQATMLWGFPGTQPWTTYLYLMQVGVIEEGKSWTGHGINWKRAHSDTIMSANTTDKRAAHEPL